MPSNTKENGFETLIVDTLVNSNGYEQGVTTEYNKQYAIDEDRLFRFLLSTQKKAMIDLFWCVVAKHNIRTQNKNVPVIDLKRIEELFSSHSLNTVFHCIRNHEYEIKMPEEVKITHQEINYAGYRFKIPALCFGNMSE